MSKETNELINAMDVLSESILSMTDDEVIQEVIENGEDPEQTAEQVKGVL
jgi:hypothetical protein